MKRIRIPYKVGDKVRHKYVSDASEGIITSVNDGGATYNIDWISWPRPGSDAPTKCRDPHDQIELLELHEIVQEEEIEEQETTIEI